jgi:hypothetical protein
MRSAMANTSCLERTPTFNDLEVANLVHAALAAVPGEGRFGDRKVFIASLWATMLRMEAETGRTLTEGATLEHFKAWLLRSRLLTRDGTEDGAPLVVLCRADLVAAMDPRLVAASETVIDGATFHFVIDPAVGIDEYAPRARTRKAPVPGPRIGRVGKVGARRRAA